jgi:lipopolysaccharide heptosyltransferase I
MNFLIVRLGALGDVVHTIPAAAALRRASPAAQIHWLVEAKHRAIVDLVTAIDRSIVLEGPSFGAWRRAIRTLRETPYDAALDFQGLLKSAVLTRASGASRAIGFSSPGLREKTARPFYSEVLDCEGGHVVRKNLRLLRAIGVPDAERAPVAFPLADVASPALKTLREDLSSERGFALVNPGAAWPNKRWPAERFGEVASYLRNACGLSPVVLWGPGEESLAAAVVSASSATARLAPRTTVADLVALCRAAALVVSGDTGPLHIAAAVGAPTVSLFGPTDPSRNGPMNPLDVVLSRYAECGCHYDRRCHETRWCLADVSAADVCAAIERRLSGRSASV